MKSHHPLSKSLALASLTLFASCSSLVIHPPEPRIPPRAVSEPPSVPTFQGGKPWEIWPYGRDLDGTPLSSEEVLAGDRLVSGGGDPREALIGWLKVPQQNLPPKQKEALAFRIASTYLSLGQPEQASSYLRRYFESTGTGVDQVNLHFAFLLGWVQGQYKDYTQSLAWFSRAYELAPQQGDLRLKAQEGARYTFSTVPPAVFERFWESLKNDELLSTLWLQEEQRRAQPGFVFQESSPLVARQGPLPVPTTETPQEQQKLKVAVLLPLGGAFGSLGTKTKKGIELAFGPEEKKAIELHFIDSPQNADEAALQTEQLLSGEQYSAILGPLLSDPSLTVSEVARAAQVPVLSLSKRESFPVGAGVFRLGVTTSSQVRSLVTAATKTLGLSKFAIVAPDDAAGRQFATAFKEQAIAQGASILFENLYPKNDLQVLTSLASQVDTLDVDGVFFPDTIANAARFFSTLSQSFRSRARPLGTGSWDNRTELANSQEVLERAVFVTPFFSNSSRPIVQTFVEAFRTMYGDSPEFLAAQGFDAATLLLAGLMRQREGIPFSQAVSSISRYEGVTGVIRVEEKGEVVREYFVVEYLGGQLSELPPPLADTASPPVAPPTEGGRY